MKFYRVIGFVGNELLFTPNSVTSNDYSPFKNVWIVYEKNIRIV